MMDEHTEQDAPEAAEQADAAQQIAELQAKLQAYETAEQNNKLRQQISKETGVPENVLYGNNEEEMRQYAAELKPLLRTVHAPVLDGVDRQPEDGDLPPLTHQQTIKQLTAKIFHHPHADM